MQTTFPTTYHTPRRIRRTPLDFAAIFMGLLLLTLVVSVAFWQFWYANRIFGGVSVAGIPVGGMTRSNALRLLNRELQPYPLPPVALSYGNEQWPLLLNDASRPAALNANVDLVSAVNAAYLMGRDGPLRTRIGEQLGLLLVGGEITPHVAFEPGQLRQAVAQIAAQIRHPAQAGSQVGNVIIEARSGVDVDVEQTLDALLLALQHEVTPNKPLVVPVAARPILPPETVVQPSTAEVSQPTLSPLRLVDPKFGLEMAIDPSELNGLLFSQQPLSVDPDRVYNFVQQWAAQIDVSARDARLQFNPDTGTVNILQTSQSGRVLNIEKSASAIQNALETGRAQAELVIDDVAPAVDMNNIPNMGIRELVASGSTYFAGSSAARVRNIEVAASKLEGVVIPPGKVFSFNQNVQDVSAANGFEDSLIIWGDQTAVGVGGGVCQVSTTVFRAAYNGGMPIVERYNHGYVVSWYGAPGLDATIYTPTVDFKFRNDTDAYLLIDPVVDAINGVITMNFYGTSPNRQVTIDEPVQTDIIQPEPPKYTIDETLAAGQRKQVEWQAQGMTVEVTRTIVENGETRTDTLKSKYRPWQAVFLVGPGTDVPATPVPAEGETTEDATTTGG
ncbi:MAG: VanW family protein [Caldilineaceae bacterium]|nr:VanW family protein [Caldilineaceae bacterium]